MIHFTPVSALLGGILIGLAALLLLWLQGRIAGISGILAGLMDGAKGDRMCGCSLCWDCWRGAPVVFGCWRCQLRICRLYRCLCC